MTRATVEVHQVVAEAPNHLRSALYVQPNELAHGKSTQRKILGKKNEIPTFFWVKEPPVVLKTFHRRILLLPRSYHTCLVCVFVTKGWSDPFGVLVGEKVTVGNDAYSRLCAASAKAWLRYHTNMFSVYCEV